MNEEEPCYIVAQMEFVHACLELKIPAEDGIPRTCCFHWEETEMLLLRHPVVAEVKLEDQLAQMEFVQACLELRIPAEDDIPRTCCFRSEETEMLVLRHPVVVGVKVEDQMVGECQLEYQFHSEMCQTDLGENLVGLMEVAHSEQRDWQQRKMSPRSQSFEQYHGVRPPR